MAELKILGAQRVKALQKILDDKMNQALKELPMLTHNALMKEVDGDFFSEEWLKQYDEVEKEFLRLSGELQAVRRSAEHLKIRNKITNDSQKYRDEVKKQFSDKKNKLWLCDTMEEAKAIVGIT